MSFLQNKIILINYQSIIPNNKVKKTILANTKNCYDKELIKNGPTMLKVIAPQTPN